LLELANVPTQKQSIKKTHRSLIESGPVAVVRPTKLDSHLLIRLIANKEKELKDKLDNEPEGLAKVSKLGNQLVVIATRLKPVIDLLVPESPEYQVPYNCLMIIFDVSLPTLTIASNYILTNSQGFIARKEKMDKIPEQMRLLSANLTVLQFYKDIFPTTEMKTSLAEYYLHTLDLLWRLARYSRLGFFGTAASHSCQCSH
jgi:hypothetical protein